MNLLPPLDQEQMLNVALDRTVAGGKAAADHVMEQFKKNNLARFISRGTAPELALLQSLWVHHRLRATPITLAGVDFVIDVMNLCISGDLETAYYIIANMEPDDMSEPYHFLSADVLGELAMLIGSELV